MGLIFLTSINVQAGFWEDTWREIASPVTTPAKYYLLGGSALTGILVIDSVEDSLGHDIQNETVEDKPLGSFSPVGDIGGQMVPNALYIGGMYAMYYFTDEEIYKSRTLHMFKSTLYSAVSATIIKAIAREPRPDTDNRDSFPSGHTTTAFAFAAVVGTEHEWYWGVPAYGLAGLVAWSRINDNKHRLHDVVGGAVLGLTYGLSLHYLYKKKDQNVTLLPYGNGVAVQYTVDF